MLESQCLQVLKTLSRNWFDREKRWIRKTVESNRREIKQIVEDQMRLDDKTTAYQLHRLSTERGYSISLRTVLRCRTALGWTFSRGSAYCQLIREVNKCKRLVWARAHLHDTFDEAMSVLCRWRTIADLRAESKESPLDQSPGKYLLSL